MYYGEFVVNELDATSVVGYWRMSTTRNTITLKYFDYTDFANCSANIYNSSKKLLATYSISQYTWTDGTEGISIASGDLSYKDDPLALHQYNEGDTVTIYIEFVES